MRVGFISLSVLAFSLLTLSGRAQDLSADLGLGTQSATDAQKKNCTSALAPLDPDCQKTADLSAPSAVRSSTGLNALKGVHLPTTVHTNQLPADATDERPAGHKAPREVTEFQRLTASSTGVTLPIFGMELFAAAPSTFAPADRVPVSADYVIGPGDELQIRVWGQINTSLQLAVDRNGSVYIPNVGNLNVAGLRFEQMDSFFRSEIGRVYRNFDLAVNMGQLRSIQIFVLGHAQAPGAYTVSSLSTLTNALFVSGGPANEGSMRHAQLKRGTKVIADLDLYDLLLRGDKSKDARLLGGDVIYIPSVGSQIAITGSVKTPAIYELKGENSIADLLELTDGMTPTADRRKVVIERITQNGTREIAEVNKGELSSTLLRNGDLIRVPTIQSKFENAVTLRGNVANPGRFVWHGGMRLRDVIPDKDSLVTRDYWRKRNVLGFVEPNRNVASDPQTEAKRKLDTNEVNAVAPDINWSYAVIERQNSNTLSTQLVPFDLGKLVLESDDAQNLELAAGDVVTIFSQDDIRVPAEQRVQMVRLEGEIKAAGVYAIKPGETLAQLIQRAGGLTPRAYLFASEFNRESAKQDQKKRLEQYADELDREAKRIVNQGSGATTLQETFELSSDLQVEQFTAKRLRTSQPSGRVVLNLSPGSNDLSQLADIQLETGDHFYVPSRPATVNVFGAVYNQNSFVHDSEYTVQDYLRTAGGPNRVADTKHAFVIQANGAVVPRRDYKNSRQKGSFEAMVLEPGDTVVIPELVMKTSPLRGIRNISQNMSQFGLGAAAVSMLR